MPSFTGHTRFVLMHTSHPHNVGAAARAMQVMGFADLVLVAPRHADVLTREEAIAMASGAVDVLTAARIVPTLAEALDGITWAATTVMTPRDFGPPAQEPRSALPAVAAAGHRVAFVFGGERHGVSNDDVYRCHASISIPTNPDYGSLNLAQAVQVIAYEWRQALGGFNMTAASPVPDRAGADEVLGLVAHWREALTHTGYFDPATPRKLMARLQQLALRAQLTPEEVHILRGIARSVLRLPAGKP